MVAGQYRSVLCLLGLVAVLLMNFAPTQGKLLQAGPSAPAATVKTSDLRDEVNGFLGKEIAAHLGDIKTLAPPPDRVIGALTTGEYSWGTFIFESNVLRLEPGNQLSFRLSLSITPSPELETNQAKP